MPLDPSVFVHERAFCESDRIGPRTRVWAFAHIMKDAQVGADCNICDHVFVESGAIIGDRVTVKNAVLVWDKVIIEDDVFLGPGVVFTNDLNPRAAFRKPTSEFLPTLVKRGATIGANATIVCGTTLGEHAFVGAGSVVTRSVPPYAIVVGVPAEHSGWMCACGTRLTTTSAGEYSCECGRRYRDGTQGLSLIS